MIYFLYDFYATEGFIRELCQSPRCLGKAKLMGTKLTFKGLNCYGQLTPEKVDDQEAFIEGVLFELDSADEKALNDQKKLHMKRVNCKVKTRAVRETKAIMYVLPSDKINNEMPSKDYFDLVETAYNELGFSRSKLYIAFVRTLSQNFRFLRHFKLVKREVKK